MKSSVETLSPTRVKLTVEVPYAELKPRLDNAVKAISSQISIPGFRPGKVPARLVEQRVGRGTIVQEAVNDALPELYGQAMAEQELRPLGQPEVDITAVPIEDESDFSFTAEVDVRPTIELPDFEKMSVSVSDIDDSALDEATDKHLEELRERFGSLVPVDREAAEGDFVVIDLTGTIGDEEIDAITGVSYEIGSRTMIEGLDDALVGMKAEDTKTFQAPLAGGDHEGEDADITVTLTAVKVRELPDLDDEFAQMASEFDTFDELKDDSRKQAERDLTLQQGVEARDKLLEQLLETLDIPVPESVVEAEIEDHLVREDRTDDDEHRAEVDESTRKALRTQLLLDHIAETREVQVEQGELIEYLIMTAQQAGIDPNQMGQLLQDENQVAMMAGEVARRKALATVLELITVTDASGNPVDLSADVEGEDGEDEDVQEAVQTDEPESADTEADEVAEGDTVESDEKAVDEKSAKKSKDKDEKKDEDATKATKKKSSKKADNSDNADEADEKSDEA